MHKKIGTTALVLGLLTAPIFAQDRPTVQQIQQQLADMAPQDQQQPQQQPPPVDQRPIPPQIIIKAGTYVTVHLNEPLSSDHSMKGDAFTATLGRPIVVDGVVIAQRGQNVIGRVTEAKKAGMVAGTSRLGIQLIELPALDGQQLPIQSELITLNGTTSKGRDAGGVAATTGVGAAIGAGFGGGIGAGIGAGAGFVAGVAGVLLTRGYPTIINPESALTFRVTHDVSISTEQSAQAFRYVEPGDYEQQGPPPGAVRRPPPPPRPPYGYAPGYGYPAYGYPYYPAPYPYWGPSFYFGPRYYYGRHW